MGNEKIYFLILIGILFASFLVFIVSFENRQVEFTKVQFERISYLDSEFSKQMEEIRKRLIKIEHRINPHRRLKQLEEWSRDACLGNFDEACGKLKPIDQIEIYD